MRVKEKSERDGLKLNIPKVKIMASGSIISWQTEGEKVEAVTGFILGGSKITVNGDHSHEIKRHLLLGRKTMTNLDNVLKTETSSQLRAPLHISFYGCTSPHGHQCAK